MFVADIANKKVPPPRAQGRVRAGPSPILRGDAQRTTVCGIK